MMEDNKKMDSTGTMPGHSCCGSKFSHKSVWCIVGSIVVAMIIFCAGYKIGVISSYFHQGYGRGGFCMGPTQGNMMWGTDQGYNGRGMMRWQKMVAPDAGNAAVQEEATTSIK